MLIVMHGLSFWMKGVVHETSMGCGIGDWIPYSTKFSLNAHTLYWHKNFVEFNFAHSAGCSPGSSGWSSRMYTPRPGPNIKCTSTVFARVQCVRSSARSISRFLLSSVSACCTPFTAVLASAMAERYISDDRDPAGSGKSEVQHGSTTVVTSS